VRKGADSFIGHDTQQVIDSDVVVGLGGGQPRTELLCCTVSRAGRYWRGAPCCKVGLRTSLRRMCRRRTAGRAHAFSARRFDVCSPAKMRKMKLVMFGNGGSITHDRRTPLWTAPTTSGCDGLHGLMGQGARPPSPDALQCGCIITTSAPITPPTMHILRRPSAMTRQNRTCSSA
jgi:hypothetical protein